MNTQDIVRKKRALYTGLSPYLDGTDLMKVLAHWEANYSNSATFSVRYFISDISKVIGRKIDTKKILINVVSSLNKPESELLPDPNIALKRYKQSQNIPNTIGQYKIQEAEAFELLIEKWLNLVKPKDLEQITRSVSRALPHADLQNDFIMLISRWLNTDENFKCPSYVEAEDLRILTNLFYQGFCEVLGPVTADELLNEAVTRLQANGGAVYRDVFVKLL